MGKPKEIAVRAGDVVDSRTEPLGAYLQKRHASGKAFFGGAWSKRWVHVNEERGRLHIGKSKGKDGTTVVRAHCTPRPCHACHHDLHIYVYMCSDAAASSPPLLTSQSLFARTVLTF